MKPSSVSDIDSTYTAGAKDESMRENDYLPPSDNGLTLRKTNKDNKLLAGSSWKIKNLGTKEEFTVTDNKKPGDNDKNTLEDLYKEDGLINVALPEGRYEITESKAPEGYKLDNTTRKFVIHDRTGASFGMGAITNEPENPEKPENSDTPDKPGTPDKPSKSESPSTSTTPRRDTSTPSTSKTPTTPVDENTHKDNGDKETPVEENTPSFAATTTPISPVENNNNSSDSFTPNSPSTPYQPKKVSGDTQPLNDSKAGPEVNTGGNITLSFWDKVKGIFS